MTHDRDERIRQRAYEIWEREGRPEGKHDEHWQRAAREVDEEERHAGSMLSEAARNIKDYAARVVTAGLTAAADVVEEAMKPKRARQKAEAPKAETAATATKAGGTPRGRKTTGPAPEQVQSDTPEAEYEAGVLAVPPEPPKGRTQRKTAAVEPTAEAAAPTSTRRKAAAGKPTTQEAKPVRTGTSAAGTSGKPGKSRAEGTKEGARGTR